MQKYIGLDVHCKWTVFVAQDSNGKVIKKGKVTGPHPKLLWGFWSL